MIPGYKWEPLNSLQDAALHTKISIDERSANLAARRLSQGFAQRQPGHQSLLKEPIFSVPSSWQRVTGALCTDAVSQPSVAAAV